MEISFTTIEDPGFLLVSFNRIQGQILSVIRLHFEEAFRCILPGTRQIFIHQIEGLRIAHNRLHVVIHAPTRLQVIRKEFRQLFIVKLCMKHIEKL